MIAKYLIIAVVSYFLGSCNFSIILSKTLEKQDIRESGSGNAGATNMLRTYGKSLAILTMIGDILKVALAILIAFLILDAPLDTLFKIADNMNTAETTILHKEFAGFFCVLGHMFPLYFKFKGGKGVATCAGMVILVDWRIALILFAVFVVTIAVSKMISLGSIIIAILYPVLVALYYKDLTLILIAVLFALIVIVAHRQNIKRILNGTENKLSSKKNK